MRSCAEKRETIDSDERSQLGHTYSITLDARRHTWSVERLWREAQGLEALRLPIEAFELGECPWLEPGEAPSMRWVIEHCRRLLEADLRYPIILSASGRVMDGMHRLARAWVEGRPWVRAVQFAQDPPADNIEELGDAI